MDVTDSVAELRKNKRMMGLSVVVAVMLLVSWFGVVDKQSTEYVDGAIVQASVAFGTARILNAAISVAQSFTVGAGLQVSPGEILDPINDIVEQYASLMQFAIGSLIIQKLLIEITSDLIFKILITLSGVALLASLVFRITSYSNFLLKLFVFLVFLRFALVSVVALNGITDRLFLEEKTQQEVAALNEAAEQLEQLEKQTKLSNEQKMSLTQTLEGLRTTRSDLEKKQASVQTQIVDLEQKVKEAETRLSDLEEKLTTLQRYNYFNRDEKVKEAVDELDSKKEELAQARSTLEDIEEAIAENDEETIAINNTLEGKPNTMMESLGQGVSGAMTKISSLGSTLTSVKDLVADWPGRLLDLMAIFVLKTLLLPLLFLFFLSKVTEYIWGIDIKEKLRFASHQAKSVPTTEKA